jgi:hypothetical protein
MASSAIAERTQLTIHEIAKLRELRFFPFPFSQKLQHHIKCDVEGELVMFELPSVVLQPGARGWSDVLMLEERIELMRLFVFLLHAACECNATVALETVVNGKAFKELHHEIIGSDVLVTAYRLWVPLDAPSQIQFLTSIAGTICPAHLGELAATR